MSILTSKLTFKKLAAGAAILGLVAVPSFVGAQKHISAGTNTTADTTASADGSSVRAAAAADTTTTVSTTKPKATLSADVAAGATAKIDDPADGSNTVPPTAEATSTAKVSLEAAINTAQAKFTSKTVANAKLLDGDASTPAYLVTFSDKSKIVVDGASGKITFSYDAVAMITTGTWLQEIAL